MDAKHLLQRMCSRRGVPLHVGLQLLPLLERALGSGPGVRDRILALADDALVHEQIHPAGDLLEVVESQLDQDVLKTLAETLHTWDPNPESLLSLEIPKEFMPDELTGEGGPSRSDEAA